MKVMLCSLFFLCVGVHNVHAELTPEWEVDLFAMTGLLGGGNSNGGTVEIPLQIRGQSDGSVLLHYYSYRNDLFVLNSSGELMHSVTNLYIDYYRPTVVASHGNHIILSVGSSNSFEDNRQLYFIEMQEESYTVTTSAFFRVASAVVYEDRADAIYIFNKESQLLTKYRLPGSPPALEASVASGVDGSNYVMNWNSSDGISYQIQSSTNLVDWSDVGPAITGTGAPITWANALTNSSSFFRVIEQ